LQGYSSPDSELRNELHRKDALIARLIAESKYYYTPCFKKTVKIFTNFDNFCHKDGQDGRRWTYFSPYLIYVNALPCETQMHQIVIFCGDYLYPIVHFCIVSLTKGAT